MISEEIIEVPVSGVKGNLSIALPDWLRVPAGWWANGKISDEEFTNSIQNLIEREIIKL